MKKLKTYVLMIAQNYMSDHPQKGEPTNFPDKILKGLKNQTIRSNYERWCKICHEVNSGKACLSVRIWKGKPYRSAQKELIKLFKIRVERVFMTYAFNDVIEITLGDKYLYYSDSLALAKQDGFDTWEDFFNWFYPVIRKSEHESFSGVVIYFKP